MHIVVVENEPVLAKRIQRLTTEVLGDRLSKLRWFNTIDEAVDYLAENTVDLLLLDLNINDLNGLAMLRMTAAGAFQTIIISANGQQANTAFEYGVLDYVKKPFTKARLQKAFNRFLEPDPDSDVDVAGQMKYLAIHQDDDIDLIPVTKICYLQAGERHTEVLLTDGTRRNHQKSLNKLTILLPKGFERVHKSYVVNMAGVKGMLTNKGVKYELQLKNGELIPVDKTFYRIVLKYFI